MHFDIGLKLPDLLVLLGYFIVVAAIGVIASRLIRSREDFIMGGRRFGKVLTTMFTFASGTHSEQAVGVAAECYKIRSLAGFWYQGVMIFTLPIYWLVSPVFRRARVMTTADFFERRFGTGFMLLYAVFSLFILAGYSSVGLFGSAKLVEALTGGNLSWKAAVPVIALIAFFYGILGGLVATVWNDFLQGLLTVVMSLLMVPFFWYHIGGLHGFQHALGADRPHAFDLVLTQGMTIQWIIMMSINSFLLMVVQPHIMANAGAARTEMDSRVGFISGLILKRLMTIPWALAGVMAVAMYSGSPIDKDHAFGRLARDLLPVGFTGLMIACVLASVMDGVAVMMVMFAGIYTNGIHKRLFPGRGERRLLVAGRAASLVFAMIVLPLPYAFTDMPQAMRFLWITVAPMGIAFLMAILWRRANRYGAMASFAVAFVAMLYAQYRLNWVKDEGLPKTILLFLSTGTLVGIVVTLLTPAEDPGRTFRFFLLLRTRLGDEHILRNAGLVEVPGTGTFEDPGTGGLPAAPVGERWPRPSKQTVYGFIAVTMIAFSLIAIVKVLAWWLGQG